MNPFLVSPGEAPRHQAGAVPSRKLHRISVLCSLQKCTSRPAVTELVYNSDYRLCWHFIWSTWPVSQYENWFLLGISQQHPLLLLLLLRIFLKLRFSKKCSCCCCFPPFISLIFRILDTKIRAINKNSQYADNHAWIIAVITGIWSRSKKCNYYLTNTPSTIKRPDEPIESQL